MHGTTVGKKNGIGNLIVAKFKLGLRVKSVALLTAVRVQQMGSTQQLASGVTGEMTSRSHVHVQSSSFYVSIMTFQQLPITIQSYKCTLQIVSSCPSLYCSHKIEPGSAYLLYSYATDFQGLGRVELYLYSSLGHNRARNGVTLPFSNIW
jgi:hypothetical protein